MVKESITEIFDIGSKFETALEKKEARKIYAEYLKNYPNISSSQKDIVQDLVVHIINKNYINGQINKAKKSKSFVHNSLFDQLKQVEEHIYELKEKIGIDKEIEKGELTGLQAAQKKFEQYINEHRNEFTCACSNCGTMLLLRRRVGDFQVINHPWFAGRWFFNYPVLKFVKEGILTKEQAWEILCGASKGKNSKSAFTKEYCVDYINFCLDRWAEITDFLSEK